MVAEATFEAVVVAAGRSYYYATAAADRVYYNTRYSYVLVRVALYCAARAMQRPLRETVWRGWVAGWPCRERVGYGGGGGDRVAAGGRRWVVKGYRASLPPPPPLPLFST